MMKFGRIALMVGVLLSPTGILASPVDFKIEPTSPETRRNFEKGMGRYILNGFLAHSKQSTTVMADLLRFESDDIAEPYRAEVLTCQKDGYFDLSALRGVWQKYFQNLRADLGVERLITPDLATFAHNTRFQQWDQDILKRSDVKERTRVFYRSPRGLSPRISVAQTLDSETGDLNAPVRETEVAVERNDYSGDWDFFAYDQQGQLQIYSEFPAGQRPSPHVCSGCHYDSGSRTVSRILRDNAY